MPTLILPNQTLELKKTAQVFNFFLHAFVLSDKYELDRSNYGNKWLQV